jgi:hypothetical protein
MGPAPGGLRGTPRRLKGLERGPGDTPFDPPGAPNLPAVGRAHI